MSFSSNYVVPGANPANQIGSSSTVSAGLGIVVTPTVNGNMIDYNVSKKIPILKTFTFPTFTYANPAVNGNGFGGGNPIVYGSLPALPLDFDITMNEQVSLTLTMATNCNMYFSGQNEFGIGVYDNTNVGAITYNSGYASPPITLNWGPSIPNAANYTTTLVVSGQQLLLTPFYGSFLSYPGAGATTPFSTYISYSLTMNYYGYAS